MRNEASKNPPQTAVRAGAGQIHCRPITRKDADAIAELEKSAYPQSLRAGGRQLRLDLEDAEWEDSNLGYGLFDGERLVGVMLVYYEVDSRHIFSYFELPCPQDISAEECLYIADFVIKRKYSRYTLRLVKEICASMGPSYERLPVYGFSTRQMMERWQARKGAGRRAGLRYVGKRQFALPQAPYEIFLVRFELQPQQRALRGDDLTVKPITTQSGWNTLEGDWDVLLRLTPGATAFQSFEFLQIWWRHFKQAGWPLILVVYQGAKVRAIAPFWIQATPYFGVRRKLLKFIGDHSEIDRPTILRNGEDVQAVEAIFNYLFDNDDQWDSMFFYEQPKDGVLLSVATELCKQRRPLYSEVAGPVCPWVDLRGSWEAFLAAKSRNFRKNLKRKLQQIQARGAVTFTTYETWPEVLQGFESYLQVEARSWKPRKGLGVAKNKKTLDYHTALLYAFGPRRMFHVRTLALAGKPIAATFGLLAEGRFLSLHVAHDLEYAEFSPGVLLTAYELEEGYGRADYTEYEFLGGFLDNKASWTSHARETQQLYVYRREPLFRLHYWWHFRLEPAVKRLTRRLGVHASLVKLRDGLRRTLRPGAQTED